MKNIKKNWKTSSTGILMIASGITLFINNHSAVTESLTLVLGGVGLLFAADSDTPPTPAA